MTAAAATRSARNARPARVPCPAEGCTYSAEPGSSIAGHVAMAHPPAVHPDQVPAFPDTAPACVGSNHQPGCAHFEAPAAAVLPAAGATFAELPLDLVDVGDNVRVEVAELEELAASIAEHGVLQPVKATGPHADGRFLVVWGQRRTLASRMAGRATVPAILLPPDADVDAHGAARSIEQLTENLFRADLPVLDEARAMRAVVDSGVSQAALAKSLGIGASTVANVLRLLETAPKVQELLAAGKITAAHAKAVVGLPTEDQARLVERAAQNGYSSRDVERDAAYARKSAADVAKNAKASAAAARAAVAALDAETVEPLAPVLVTVPWGLDADLVRKAVATAGHTVGRGYATKRPAECDCIAWQVDVNDKGKATASRTCVSEAHREAAYEARRAAQDAERALAGQAQEAVAAAVAERIRGLDEDLTRLLARALAGYSNRKWSEFMKGDLDELAADAGKRVANTLVNTYGDNGNVKLADVLAMLGIEAAS